MSQNNEVSNTLSNDFRSAYVDENNRNANKGRATARSAFKQNKSPDAPDSFTSIVPEDDKSLSYHGITLTKTGIDVKNSDLTEASMLALASELFHLEGSLQWLIGDWLVCSEEYKWGEMAAIASSFDRDVDTLYDYKGVAKGVQFRVRTRNLSFGHHKLVKSMAEEDQVHWLKLAEKKRWSVAQMRVEIRASKPKQIAPAITVPKPILTHSNEIKQLASVSKKTDRKKIIKHLKQVIREINEME